MLKYLSLYNIFLKISLLAIKKNLKALGMVSRRLRHHCWGIQKIVFLWILFAIIFFNC